MAYHMCSRVSGARARHLPMERYRLGSISCLVCTPVDVVASDLPLYVRRRACRRWLAAAYKPAFHHQQYDLRRNLRGGDVPRNPLQWLAVAAQPMAIDMDLLPSVWAGSRP